MGLSLRLSVRPILGLIGAFLVSTAVKADIYAPGDSVPDTSSEVFGWLRGDAGSTYSGWDLFENNTSPNDPIAGYTDVTPDAPGQFGDVASFTVSPGSIATGSGNIYSPFAALSFYSIVPTGTAGSNTRIVAQFRSIGELDYDSILLSASTGTAGTIAPTMMKETGRGVGGGGGFSGESVDYLALWDISDSQAEYRIDFATPAPHVSLDQFHVDSFTSNTAFVSPTAIPEPSSFAAIGMIGGLLTLRRRRRKTADR